MTESELRNLRDKRAGQLANRHRHGATTTSAALTVLVFTVGKERYGVDLADLAEVLSYSGCTVVPNPSPALLGLINVRGEIRPLFDAARLLDVEHELTDAGNVLMVRAHNTAVGFKVDRIEHVRDLQFNEVSFAKQDQVERNARHLKGVTQDTLRLIDVVSLTDQLFPSFD
jgi:purine-binding chemotaxis protein CheW